MAVSLQVLGDDQNRPERRAESALDLFELHDEYEKKEKCGVFGIWGTSEASRITYSGLFAQQHRGQESVGVAVFDEQGGARVVRSMGTISPGMASELDGLMDADAYKAFLANQ